MRDIHGNLRTIHKILSQSAHIMSIFKPDLLYTRMGC